MVCVYIYVENIQNIIMEVLFKVVLFLFMNDFKGFLGCMLQKLQNFFIDYLEISMLYVFIRNDFVVFLFYYIMNNIE